MSMITITKENFKAEVSESKIPVVVDFWAPWCGYCRRLSPAMEQIQDSGEGKFKVGKINIDEEPELAEQFKVMTIPTLILFEGDMAGTPLVAPQSKVEVDRWLKERGVME